LPIPNEENVRVIIPATITVGNDVSIEIKRGGQYVVAPGSVHPGNPDLEIPPGHVYSEMEPWPTTTADVPEFPLGLIQSLTGSESRSASPPLPPVVKSGDRDIMLHREGSRLRRLGHEQVEILARLRAINQNRCKPPMEERKVEGIASRCARYQPADDPFPLTDTGNAEYFASAVGDDTVVYDHDRRLWFVFREHYWLQDKTGGGRPAGAFPAAGWTNAMSYTRRQSLPKPRLVAASEISHQGGLNDGLIKSLTGNDMIKLVSRT
jgi:hypothetical protein